MKRRPRIIKLCAYVLLFAAGGAIVNVAVAWGCLWGMGAVSHPGINPPTGVNLNYFTGKGPSSGLPFRAVQWSLGDFTGDQLPDNLIWPGFIANTFLYATLLCGAVWIVLLFRGAERVDDGRCPACGYKIAKGVGPVCSECGHPLGTPGSSS